MVVRGMEAIRGRRVVCAVVVLLLLVGEGGSVADETAGANATLPGRGRRLVEGLACDRSIYDAFLASDEGQDIFIMATLCESRIVYLKNARAGWYGPVEQQDLREAMCSEECLRSDELHTEAMSLSRCTCTELSADTFVEADFCLESSARLLCTHLGECGHWGCELHDFHCLRHEWDRYYACTSAPVSTSALVVLLAIAASLLRL